MATERLLNLNFHGIGVPTERDFGDGEREFWATGETFEAVLDLAASRADVTISFDDGNTTDISIALPALTRRGIKATFFIVPGWLSTPGFISAADVQTLAEQGMTIGNHGLNHHVWTEMNPAALRNEIRQGRTELQKLTGTPIETLAIPYGRYDDSVLETVHGHGYTHVFSSDGGTANANAWLQPREQVKTQHTPADIEQLFAALE